MDTFHVVYDDELETELRNANIPILSDDEEELINHFLRSTKWMLEVEQLFGVYRVNLDLLKQSVTFYTDDRIECNMPMPNMECTPFTLVNTLVINYLASAKGLTDAIDTYIMTLFNFNVKAKLAEFKSLYTSKEFDSSFNYRLLYHLRNYSQHGHLPVSVYQIDGINHASIDLNQIKNTLNFDVDLELIEPLIDEMDDKGLNAMVSLSLAILEYNASIARIYHGLFIFSRETMFKLKRQIRELIKKCPELIYKSKGPLYRAVVFCACDNQVHVFWLEDDTIGTFKNYQRKASRFQKAEELLYCEYRKHFRFIPSSSFPSKRS